MVATRSAGLHVSGSLGCAPSVALQADFFHYGLDEGFGALHAGENGLQVEGRFGRVAGGGAVDTVLADHDQGIREKVEGYGETASLDAHHEFVALQFRPLFVEYAHDSSVPEEP
jgi:hypothetical protein